MNRHLPTHLGQTMVSGYRILNISVYFFLLSYDVVHTQAPTPLPPHIYTATKKCWERSRIEAIRNKLLQYFARRIVLFIGANACGFVQVAL